MRVPFHPAHPANTCAVRRSQHSPRAATLKAVQELWRWRASAPPRSDASSLHLLLLMLLERQRRSIRCGELDLSSFRFSGCPNKRVDRSISLDCDCGECTRLATARVLNSSRSSSAFPPSSGVAVKRRELVVRGSTAQVGESVGDILRGFSHHIWRRGEHDGHRLDALIPRSPPRPSIRRETRSRRSSLCHTRADMQRSPRAINQATDYVVLTPAAANKQANRPPRDPRTASMPRAGYRTRSQLAVRAATRGTIHRFARSLVSRC